MHENNNQPAIQRLSSRLLGSNRSRNRFVVAAIVLTTFMIATVFSIGFSYAQNYQVMSERMVRTKADVALTGTNGDQRRQVSELEGVRHVGTVSILSSVQLDSAVDFVLEARDLEAWEQDYGLLCSDVTGHFPRSEKEIMVSREGLKALGIETPVEGMEVELTYQNGQSGRFALSGWFTNYDWPQGGFPQIIFSEDWLDQGEQSLYVQTKFGQLNTVSAQLEKMAVGSQEVIRVAGESNDSSEVSVYMAIIIGTLAAFLMLSGYLLIYNILYISVTKDIRFYGMLKTIGASSRQIRRLVRGQMFRLAALGIPLGLVLALLCSFGVIPLAMKALVSGMTMGNLMPADISFHPLIFLGTALFSFATIVISCRRPARTAGRVSPMEALRYTGLPAKTKNKRGTSGGKVYRMAWSNIFRDKKRAALVFASLFMGTITLLGIQSFLGSLDVQNYIDRYVPHDFSFQHLNGENPLTEELKQTIEHLDGVTAVYTTEDVNGFLELDAEQLEPLIQNAARLWDKSEQEILQNLTAADEAGVLSCAMMVMREGSEAFLKGEEWLLYSDEESEAAQNMIGRNLTAYTAEGTELTLPIGGVVTRHELSYGSQLYSRIAGMPEGLVLSPAAAEKLGLPINLEMIEADVEPDQEAYVKQELTALAEKLPNQNFLFESRMGKAEEFSLTMQTMDLLTSGISILLILIGVLNFINTMLTGVYNRRRELAVMESVGMTKRQIFRMLTMEGFYYALLTTGIIGTVGTLIMEGIGAMATHVADYAVFHYPWGLVALLVGLLFGICLSVPALIYRKISKESVIERAREGAD